MLSLYSIRRRKPERVHERVLRRCLAEGLSVNYSSRIARPLPIFASRFTIITAFLSATTQSADKICKVVYNAHIEERCVYYVYLGTGASSEAPWIGVTVRLLRSERLSQIFA